MADVLEDAEFDDRLIDRNDYLKQNLNLLKAQFRDSAIEAEASTLQPGFEAGFKMAAKLSLQLGRLRGGLSAFPDTLINFDEMRNLMIELDNLNERFKEFEIVAWTEDQFANELSVRDVPAFVDEEMTSLFGKEFDFDSKSCSTDILSDTSQILQAKLNELRKSSENLLNRGCDLLHKLGICDEFVYQE